MMKITKEKKTALPACAARSLHAAAVAFCLMATAGCSADYDPAEAPHPTSNGRTTICAGMPGKSGAQTRVAYDDNQVGVTPNDALKWEASDQLTVARLQDDGTYKYVTGYTLTTGAGTTTATFEGTEIPEGDNLWNVYSPATVTIDKSSGTATLSMDGQMQTGDLTQTTGSTVPAVAPHLKNYIFLAKIGLANLGTAFTFEMKSSILKLVLTGIPAEVGTLETLLWEVKDNYKSKVLSLAFAQDMDAVTFNSSKQDLTAYLAFMPDDMRIKGDGTFTVTLNGSSQSYKATIMASEQTFDAGKRYTLNISRWTGLDSDVTIPHSDIAWTAESLAETINATTQTSTPDAGNNGSSWIQGSGSDIDVNGTTQTSTPGAGNNGSSWIQDGSNTDVNGTTQTSTPDAGNNGSSWTGDSEPVQGSEKLPTP